MTAPQKEFIAALRDYVAAVLAEAGAEADYCRKAVCVADARNHLFRPAGSQPTDEAADIYAIRDLCRLDEDTLRAVPDEGRIASISRNYF